MEITHETNPDSLYRVAAGLLGLYDVAFSGARTNALDRRRLRDAWQTACTIAPLSRAM
jgi:hypothetical protein